MQIFKNAFNKIKRNLKKRKLRPHKKTSYKGDAPKYKTPGTAKKFNYKVLIVILFILFFVAVLYRTVDLVIKYINFTPLKYNEQSLDTSGQGWNESV